LQKTSSPPQSGTKVAKIATAGITTLKFRGTKARNTAASSVPGDDVGKRGHELFECQEQNKRYSEREQKSV
jgi:hypothetical protein